MNDSGDGQAHQEDITSRNGLRLIKAVYEYFKNAGPDFALAPQILKTFHAILMEGCTESAGRFRKHSVKIIQSTHRPPHADSVAGLIDDMCDTVNQNVQWPATETAAYLLWRIAWIHPFMDGNGRVARAVAEYATCVRLRHYPIGKISVNYQIANDKPRFLAALADADEAWRESSIIDVSRLKSLYEEYLTVELKSRHGGIEG